MALDERLDDGNPYRSPDAFADEGGELALADPESGATQAAHALEPLVRAGGWITFAGVLMIIYGGLTIMTIVGAIIGWLPLWIGILLTQAPARYKEGIRQGDVELMRQGSDKLRLAIKIWGIATVVGIGLVVLVYGLMFLLLAIGVISGGRQ